MLLDESDYVECTTFVKKTLLCNIMWVCIAKYVWLLSSALP